MKKALVPMVASLALCGAATAALIVDSARAQTSPRRPVMVAMMAPRTLLPATATPPVDGGANPPGMGPRGLGPQGMQPPSAAQMAARHKQMCQDDYAHQVGDLAYLEAKLNLTPTQQPLFDRWKSVKLDIAKRGEADCSTRELPTRNANARPSPLDGMAREEDILKRRLSDLDAERPVLSALYNTLSASQKDALMHPDAMMGDGPMRGRMFAAMNARHGRMGPQRPMGGPGPGDRPPPAPGAPPLPQ